MEKINIGIIQNKSRKTIDENLNLTIQQIEDLANNKAHIICLQELFLTDYFCFEENYDFFNFAEKVPGETTQILGEIAKLNEVVIIASLFEKRAPGIYHNTVAVLDADGTYLGKYRKMHIPDDPGFYEKFYFTPGDLGYKVFKTKYANIGVLICWDQWFPEAARLTSLMGAEMLFYPTAIGWDINENDDKTNQEQLQAWLTIQKSHAIANGIPVIGVNRTGEQNGTKFWGNSFVSNAFGNLIYHANHQNEVAEVVEVNLQESKKYREVWPFLRDRRIDTYHQLTKRYIDED